MVKAPIHVMVLESVLANLISSEKHAMNASQGTLNFHVVRVSRRTVLQSTLYNDFVCN